jgi:hypothetical protein
MPSPKMTRGHFVLIAEMLRGADLEPATRARIAGHFADHLTRTNPLFDRARFLAACGVPTEGED